MVFISNDVFSSSSMGLFRNDRLSNELMLIAGIFIDAKKLRAKVIQPRFL